MRPTPFSIEIPDRPVYQPGSGPAMAPITLQPDDNDTGWIIAGTVDFQGVCQYVVTPKDNPAHRRPVKKQHILDWVSPKAHEDFEYAQYKLQIEAEQEREVQVLTKAAAIKKRRHGMGLARQRAKARKPFARYMQLEQAEDSDRGNMSGQLSSPEHSPDELNTEVSMDHGETLERKRSVEFRRYKASNIKQQGLAGASKASLVLKAWKPPLSKPRQQFQAETTGEDTDMEDDTEITSTSTNTNLSRQSTTDRPILPPQSRFSVTPISSLSPRSAPSMFVAATVSASKVVAKFHRSGPTLEIRTSTNAPKSSSATVQSKATPLRNATPSRKAASLQPSKHGKGHPPILPPTGLWKPPASLQTSQTPNFALDRGGEYSDSRRQKRKRHSLSPTDQSTSSERNSEANSQSNGVESRPIISRSTMDRSHLSDSALIRGMRASNEHSLPKPKQGEASRSSSSGSSNVLRWPSKRKIPQISNEQSKYFESMKMKRNDKKHMEHDEEETESEETWDIHGILDDEVRRVNGRLVRHYLCEWVGDWDPTWEPEENVSTDAISRYKERKKRRISFGFDGTTESDTISENCEALERKTSRRLDNIPGQETEASDSEAFADALREATRLLTSTGN